MPLLWTSSITIEEHDDYDIRFTDIQRILEVAIIDENEARVKKSDRSKGKKLDVWPVLHCPQEEGNHAGMYTSRSAPVLVKKEDEQT